MKKKSTWIVWLLLLAMTAGLVLTGCSKDDTIDPNALQPGEAEAGRKARPKNRQNLRFALDLPPLRVV